MFYISFFWSSHVGALVYQSVFNRPTALPLRLFFLRVNKLASIKNDGFTSVSFEVWDRFFTIFHPSKGGDRRLFSFPQGRHFSPFLMLMATHCGQDLGVYWVVSGGTELLPSLALRLCPLVVDQEYETDVNKEYVIRGNSALMRCQWPSFVADFLSVESWSIEERGVGSLIAADAVLNGKRPPPLPRT